MAMAAAYAGLRGDSVRLVPALRDRVPWAMETVKALCHGRQSATDEIRAKLTWKHATYLEIREI
jgi:hypothetical protein